MKQQGGLAQGKPASNKKTPNAKKHSPRKMKKVQAALEKVKAALLPGLDTPEHMSNQQLASRQFA